MFIAALFAIARTWKQPKCPSTDEWIKNWYIHTMECYSSIKMRTCSISLIYMQLSSFPDTIFWRDCLFSLVYSCLLCCRLIDHNCVGWFMDSFFCSIDLYVCFCTVMVFLSYFKLILLEYSFVTMFFYFLLSSHLGHHRALSRVPWAMQLVLITYLFHM